MAGERLLEAIQRAADGQIGRSTPTDFIYGTVISVSPLIIKPENSEEITEDFLIPSALCKPFVTTVFRHKHKDSVGGETDEQLLSVTIWRGLAIGDRVRMLRCNSGQKFYLLDREGSFP